MENIKVGMIGLGQRGLRMLEDCILQQEGIAVTAVCDLYEDSKHDFDWRKHCCGNAEKYAEKYDHPVWKEYMEAGVQGSHDGMDWLEFKTFFECLKENKPMPIDVYDAASWMVISVLSEKSIAKGSAPVTIPDFTEGKWITR